MYERGIKGWLKHFDFILLDMLSLALALFVAFSLRFSQAWGSYQTELYRELLVMLMLPRPIFFIVSSVKMCVMLRQRFWTTKRLLIAT